MRLKELKDLLNTFSCDLLDKEIYVDTDAARYDSHFVKLTDLLVMDDKRLFEDKYVFFTLDNEAKIYSTTKEREKNG